MSERDESALDHAIRVAMQSRPEPQTVSGLAARAMAMARRSAGAVDVRLSAYRRASRWATAAAGMLIVAILVVGGLRLNSALKQLSSSDTTTTSSSTNWLQDLLGLSSQTTAASEGAWIAMLVLILIVTAIAMLPRRRMIDSLGFWAP